MSNRDRCVKLEVRLLSLLLFTSSLEIRTLCQILFQQLFDMFQSLVDMFQLLVDMFQSSCDMSQSLVDMFQSLVVMFQSLVDMAPKYILEQFLEAELLVNIIEHKVCVSLFESLVIIQYLCLFQ